MDLIGETAVGATAIAILGLMFLWRKFDSNAQCRCAHKDCAHYKGPGKGGR